jgi:hypothetical protein
MMTSVGMVWKVPSLLEADVVFLALVKWLFCFLVYFKFSIASLWLLSMEYVT